MRRRKKKGAGVEQEEEEDDSSEDGDSDYDNYYGRLDRKKKQDREDMDYDENEEFEDDEEEDQLFMANDDEYEREIVPAVIKGGKPRPSFASVSGEAGRDATHSRRNPGRSSPSTKRKRMRKTRTKRRRAKSRISFQRKSPTAKRSAPKCSEAGPHPCSRSPPTSQPSRRGRHLPLPTQPQR